MKRIMNYAGPLLGCIALYRKSYYTGLDSYRLGKLSFLLLQLFSVAYHELRLHIYQR